MIHLSKKVNFQGRKLIYDNAACRKGKGTHFALRRTKHFLSEYHKKHGSAGYILKCDIRKFFDSIDHTILKQKWRKVIPDEAVQSLLEMLIDSYEKQPGKGLPLGNQTSQWFALYYLDQLDRFVKERMQIRYYSRYMDDCILIHPDKEYLKKCLVGMQHLLKEHLKLEFNEKTQICPVRNGVDYLGVHFYLSETGKVILKVRQQTKYKYKRKLKKMQREYSEETMTLRDIKQVLASYHAHLGFGHTYQLRKRAMAEFVLNKVERNGKQIWQ